MATFVPVSGPPTGQSAYGCHSTCVESSPHMANFEAALAHGTSLLNPTYKLLWGKSVAKKVLLPFPFSRPHILNKKKASTHMACIFQGETFVGGSLLPAQAAISLGWNMGLCGPDTDSSVPHCDL